MIKPPLTSPELICSMVKDFPDIVAIHLFRSISSLPIQSTLGLLENEHILISEALETRLKTQAPFWDCLMQLISIRGLEARNLLKLASRHNPQHSTLESLRREEVTLSVLERKIETLSTSEALALSSRVLCPGSVYKHIPMLDFHCRISVANDELVKSVLGTLGMHGYIAHSGQSYHFIGSKLISENELLQFLSNSLLYCPITDRAWIAHQLLERACGLRISVGKNYRTSPIVFAKV